MSWLLRRGRLLHLLAADTASWVPYRSLSASTLHHSEPPQPQPKAKAESEAKPQLKKAKKRKYKPKRGIAELQYKKRAVFQITLSSLKPGHIPVSAVAGDAELLASYNWINIVNKEDPKIYVPGGAPLWQGPEFPLRVSQDVGLFFKDQNVARVPDAPFLPVFEAVKATRPDYSFNDIDLVANRNSLSWLLGWITQGSKWASSGFELQLHLIGNTLLIQKLSNDIRSRRRLNDADKQYGFNFENAVTKYPQKLEGSFSHHRVLKYKMGNLNCAVICEVDAEYHESAEVAKAKHTDGTSHDEVADIGTALKNKNQRIQVIPRGSGTEQANAAELKTRSKFRSGLRTKNMTQLWFGRTPFLLVGYHHKDGVFKRTAIRDCSSSFGEWANTHQTDLRKLVNLILRLREAVRRTKGKSCLLVAQGRRSYTEPWTIKLLVPKRPMKPLAEDMRARFWKGDGVADGAADGASSWDILVSTS